MAFRAGHRQAHRDDNVATAFTYGKKLKYSNIDDPLYAWNLRREHCFKKRKHKKCRYKNNHSIEIKGLKGGMHTTTEESDGPKKVPTIEYDL